ncbi:MAG TPA: hypothetical protein V6D47_05945 [Oscillatoriaceae cyanobacterium]
MAASLSSPSFNPNRALVAKSAPAPAPKPAAPQAAPQATDSVDLSNQQSRLQEQEQMASDMLHQLGTDAKIAGIMAVPVMGQQAMAIAMSASARAMSRYETEVPQQDFNTLYNQEMTKAHAQILALPGEYGQTISNGATAVGNGIVYGAKATGNAFVTGAEAVGNFFKDIALGTVHGIGWVLKGIGGGIEGAGKALDPSNS